MQNVIARLGCTFGAPSRRRRRPPHAARRIEALEPRRVLDSTVVFNEIMYNPGDDQQREWIELHNQMAVDMDISRWHLDGLGYTFPPGTIVPGGGYLVLAKSVEQMRAAAGLDQVFGPYAGQLANGGERLRLLNNSQRVMDEITYGDRHPWPLGADGSGATLAKRDANQASGQPANWSVSAQLGGTPGAANFPPPESEGTANTPRSVRINELAASDAESFWIELANASDQAIDLTGYWLQAAEDAAARFVFADRSLPAGGFLLLSQSELGWELNRGDRLFLYAPDPPALADAAVVQERLQGRSPEQGDRWLYPTTPTPGRANQFQLESDIVINEIMYHAPGHGPTVDQPPTYSFTSLLEVDEQTWWRYRESSLGLPAGWAQQTHPAGVDGWEEGPALIGFESADLDHPLRTRLDNPSITFPHITTYYFEREFELNVDPTDDGIQLMLDFWVDDGAVFYLNGVEAWRFNMPAGAIDADTLAQPGVVNATGTREVILPKDALRLGTNRLSVEVHQESTTSNDIVFGAELRLRQEVTPFLPGMPYRESNEEWIELYNRSTTRTIDLSGWRLAEAVEFQFPQGTQLAPGRYLVVAADAAALRAKYPERNTIPDSFRGNLSNRHEQIVLIDAQGNPADQVHYFEKGRWPELADGGGASLELRDPFADNSQPEAWGVSDASSLAPWQSIRYRGLLQRDGFTNGVSTRYHELILGMLDAGMVLIDDVSIIEDPGGAAIERIQNGTFQQDTPGSQPQAWRIAGNHHGQVVLDPDDPANHVLQLRATGALEDRLNHAETTLADRARLRVGVEYEISLRAKWLGGSNQLHTRLYFDRLPRTTLLARPDRLGTPGAVNQSAEPNLGPTFQDLGHQPVIPETDQPVTVQVAATDPQGVGEVVLWYAVNDGPLQRVPMEPNASGRYVGQIPGQARASVVQFFVQATDLQQAQSFFPAKGVASRALYKVQDGRAREGQLHNFRIIMTPQDTDRLHERTNVMSNERLGATVVYNEREVFYDVGVRLKGSNAGRSNPTYLGFHVDFDPMQLFRGVHDSVAIDRSGRSASTPQTQDEILIKHIANHAGDIPHMYDDLVHVIAPDVRHSRTALLMMARYNDVFLDSQYENGSDGTVFKMDIAYVPNGTVDGRPESPKLPFPYAHPMPTRDLHDRGDDKEAYRSHLLIRNNRTADDYSRIIEAARVLSLSRDQLPEAAEDVIDVDQWARLFALQSLTGAADVYTRGALHHNISFYVRPGDQRVVALPWDWDFAFTAPTSQPLIGTAGTAGILLSRPTVRRLVHGHLLDIIQTTFNNEYLDRWIEHYGQVARQNLASIKSYVAARQRYVLSRLPEAVPFEITTNEGRELRVDQATVTLQGRGWINVRQIRPADGTQPLKVHWLDDDRWEVQVPVAAGPNRIVLQAIDHQGNLVGSDEITVTSSVPNRVAEFLRITEIHYNPPPPTPDERAADTSLENDDFEFLELHNMGDRPINLLGTRFEAGVEFVFPETVLQPGERAVVVQNPQAFALRYGQEVRILGQFQRGRLSNQGENLRLVTATGEIVLQFEYGDNDPWPEWADGVGGSLELIDPTTPPDQYAKAARWRASPTWGGSPGTVGDQAAMIRINEILANPAAEGPQYDAIELHNPTDTAVPLGGRYLSDAADQLLKYRIPDGTILPAQGYLVFDERHFNPNPNAPEPFHFALSGSSGEEIWLVAADDRGRVTSFLDHVRFAASQEGESWGRWPDATGRLVPLRTPTLGAANALPRVGPLVISELAFHAGTPSPAARSIDPTLREQDLDFLEIHNPTSRPMNLRGWRIRGGVDFDVEGEVTLAPQGTVVLVSFDPARGENRLRTRAFRTHYGLSDQVPLIGGYRGQLRDGGERIVLQRPADADGMWQVDEVVYDDQPPWPAATPAGESLQRIRPEHDGNQASSWAVSTATPGNVSLIAADLNGDGRVDPTDIDFLCAALSRADAAFDLNGNGQPDRQDLFHFVQHVLGTQVGDVNLDGTFNSRDLVLVFQVGEYEDGRLQNSTWADGDWNCDGEFGSGDLVAAFQAGGFVAAAAPPRGFPASLAAAIQPALPEQGRRTNPAAVGRVPVTFASELPPVRRDLRAVEAVFEQLGGDLRSSHRRKDPARNDVLFFNEVSDETHEALH